MKKGMSILVVFFLYALCSSYEANNDKLFILKTQEYKLISFSKAIGGLFYPEFIDYQQNYFNFTLRVYNQTSQNIINQVTVQKRFQSDCQFVLEDVDYGYYTKFPKYQIIGECSNATTQMTYSIRLYRSGDWQVIEGDIIQKSQDEKNCDPKPLRVINYYSSSGGLDKFVYRFCAKKQGPAIFKSYEFDSKRAYVFKQESISQLTGLTNLSLVDVLPTIGVNGKFTAYLSQTYGLILNGGSKYIQSIWKIPGGEKPYRIQRLCWSNNLAILTEGYVYFLKLDYFSNNTVNITLKRKSEKLNVASTSQCEFFTIGQTVVCSLYDKEDTKWFVLSQDSTIIKNWTQVSFINQQIRAYTSQQLCSTSSFYSDNSRYQFSLNQPSTDQTSSNFVLKKSDLKLLYGNVIDFIDTGYLFVISREPSQTAGLQNQYYASYDKAKFNSYPFIVRNQSLSGNIKNLWIEYEPIYLSNSYYPMFSVIYSDSSAVKTFIQTFTPSSSSQNFNLQKDFNMDLSISNVGYLKNLQNSTEKFYFIVQTPIQNNAVARLFINRTTFELRYPYQFETNSFTMCSITTANNQLLFYRIDPFGLTAMKAGFRFFNFLVLDDIRTLNQYRNYRVSCAHDGLFLSNPAAKAIISLNNDLQVQYKIDDLSFQDIKFTKSLILLKTGTLVEVRTLKSGDIVGVYKWSLDDLVTNKHSIGFINKKEAAYYEFGNDKIEVKDFQENKMKKNLKYK